ncbi:MAG: hypothetical protein EP317_02045 [Bacillota bacterium]|nr:MAG: hypothetical protein EP317_02045 [Bacillota bacterium]
MSSDKIMLNKMMKQYLMYSSGLLLFTIVYEQFSHGVTSINMRIAFLMPLLLGYGLAYISQYIPIPKKMIFDVWGMGITTLVSGLLLQGIFYIYGTSNDVVNIFYYVAIFIFVVTVFLYILQLIKQKKLG